MTGPTFRFHHGAVSVPDIDAAATWYCEMLGFAVERRFAIPNDTRAMFLERDGLRIELFEVPGAAPLPDDRRDPRADLRTCGNKHFAFAVSDYDRTLAEVTAKGGDVALTVGQSFGRAFFLRDCAGNVVEIVEMA